MISQGEVYIVDFGKKFHSELGKKRPAVVLQHNFLNRALENAKFPSVMVIPLSSDDIVTEYKIKIPKRDKLQKDSYVVTTWVCSVDMKRFDLETGLLTKLSNEEIEKLKEKFCEMM